jgi:hypothetical protein
MDRITITRLTGNDIDTLIPLAGRIWHAHYPDIITVEQIDYMLERGYTAPSSRTRWSTRGYPGWRSGMTTA